MNSLERGAIAAFVGMPAMFMAHFAIRDIIGFATWHGEILVLCVWGLILCAMLLFMSGFWIHTAPNKSLEDDASSDTDKRSADASR